MATCQDCKKTVSDSANACNYCGKSLQQNESKIVFVDTEEEDNVPFGTGCGKPLIFVLLIILIGIGVQAYQSYLPPDVSKAVEILCAETMPEAKRAAGTTYLNEDIGEFNFLFFKMDATTNWELAIDHLYKQGKIKHTNDELLTGSLKTLSYAGKWQSFGFYSANPRIIHFNNIAKTVIIQYFDKKAKSNN